MMLRHDYSNTRVGEQKIGATIVKRSLRVQTNNTKCVLNGILIQASNLKIVKACTIQCSPHMLISTDIYNPSTMW